MAGESVLTPCPRKNPPSFHWPSSLPHFSLSLVWSTLQWDDPFPHSYNTSSFLCICPHPLHWGLASEHPKPISFSHLLSSLRLSFLQTLRSLLSSTSQNLMPFHTTHLMNLSFLTDQFRLIFTPMLDGSPSWINPLMRPRYTQRVPSR